MDSKHRNFEKLIGGKGESGPDQSDFCQRNYEEYISLCLMLQETDSLDDEITGNLIRLWDHLKRSREGKQICDKIKGNSWAWHPLKKNGYMDKLIILWGSLS